MTTFVSLLWTLAVAREADGYSQPLSEQYRPCQRPIAVGESQWRASMSRFGQQELVYTLHT